MNAILNYSGERCSLVGAMVYVDLFPYNECVKIIIQFGISEVIYLSDKYKGTESNEATKFLFDSTGVKYRNLQKKTKKYLNYF